MNERIRELAEQANAHKLDWAYYRGEKKPENAVTLHSVDLELFAELMVRECAKVLTQHGSYFSGEGEPYHYAASLIEEHFGVEE